MNDLSVNREPIKKNFPIDDFAQTNKPLLKTPWLSVGYQNLSKGNCKSLVFRISPSSYLDGVLGSRRCRRLLLYPVLILSMVVWMSRLSSRLAQLQESM